MRILPFQIADRYDDAKEPKKNIVASLIPFHKCVWQTDPTRDYIIRVILQWTLLL